MPKQRQVSDKFWHDSYVSEELTDPDEKLLLLYLLTNQYVGITGIYEIAIRQINFDTNIPSEKIKSILLKLSDAGKVFYESGYIILANYHRYTSYNMPGVKKYVISQLEALPKAIKEKHHDIIETIKALASPTQGQGKGSQSPRQGLSEGSQSPVTVNNDGENKGQGKGKASPTQAQPYTSIPIPIPNTNTTSIPSPLSPQGGNTAAKPGKWILDPVTRKVVENPDWEGREEGKENSNSALGKGTEGKGRKEYDPNTDPNYVEEWTDQVALKNKEFDLLESEFKNLDIVDVIFKASDWAKEKHIKIKDAYKFVRGFAQKEVQNG